MFIITILSSFFYWKTYDDKMQSKLCNQADIINRGNVNNWKAGKQETSTREKNYDQKSLGAFFNKMGKNKAMRVVLTRTTNATSPKTPCI